MTQLKKHMCCLKQQFVCHSGQIIDDSEDLKDVKCSVQSSLARLYKETTQGGSICVLMCSYSCKKE